MMSKKDGSVDKKKNVNTPHMHRKQLRVVESSLSLMQVLPERIGTCFVKTSSAVGEGRPL